MQLSDWAHWPSCQANLGLASWFSCLIAVWPWVGYLGSLRLEWGEKTFRGRTEILHIKHSQYNAWDHLVSDREKWDWRLLSPSARRQIGSIALLHLWLSLTKNLSTTSLYTPDQNSARSILSQYWFPALVTSGVHHLLPRTWYLVSYLPYLLMVMSSAGTQQPFLPPSTFSSTSILQSLEAYSRLSCSWSFRSDLSSANELHLHKV